MKDEDITMWADAYAAFVGAFDTPIHRRRDDSEVAVDARERMRAWNEQTREIAAASAAATRTLEGLGYEYCGGEVWKPPVSPRELHVYEIDLPDGDERRVEVFMSTRDVREGTTTHKLCVTVKAKTPTIRVDAVADEEITEAVHIHKIDLKTLRAGDRVKVTLNGEVIDKAATLICTPRWLIGWCTLHFIDESGREFFRSNSRDVRVEEIDGRLYACGGWRVEIVEWTDSNE